jgi:cytoskeleton protein RodZ
MVAAVRTEPDTAGARLASARERAGLSLDQVADQLKLDRYTVVALEADDYRGIGAAVFVRGFLRRYAGLVGESAAEIETLYTQRPDAEARPDLSKIGTHRIEPAAFRPSLGVLPALLAALALTIAGAAWWAMYSRAPPSATATTQLPAPATPAAAPTGPTAAERSASLPVAPSDVQPAASLARRKLQLSFAGESWAEIYDARGMRLFFGFGHAGTAQELAGVAPFRLVLGNGQAVTVALEGAPVSLPAGEPGQRIRILLSATGAATALP